MCKYKGSCLMLYRKIINRKLTRKKHCSESGETWIKHGISNLIKCEGQRMFSFLKFDCLISLLIVTKSYWASLNKPFCNVCILSWQQRCGDSLAVLLFATIQLLRPLSHLQGAPRANGRLMFGVLKQMQHVPKQCVHFSVAIFALIADSVHDFMIAVFLAVN